MLLQKFSHQELENRFKTENNSRIRERLQIILYLREGKTQREVSSELKISIGIVPYWKFRFEKDGFEGLVDKKGRGRKSKLSYKQLEKISNEIDSGIVLKDGYKRGYRTKDVIEFIRIEFKVDYTLRNCRNILHKQGFTLKFPRPRHKRRNQNEVDEFKRQFKKNIKVWVRNL